MRRALFLFASVVLAVFVTASCGGSPCAVPCNQGAVCDSRSGQCVADVTGTGGGGGDATDAGIADAGAGGGGASTPYCTACGSSSECGGGGNYCLGFSFGNYCGTDCSSGQACPANARCMSIVDSSNTVVGQNCVPNSGLTCSTGGTGGGSGSSCADTWAGGWPPQFFNANCSGCHSSEFSSLATVQYKASSISARISSGNMPQNRSLSSGDRTRILAWLSCGAP